MLRVANALFTIVCVTGPWMIPQWARNRVRFVSRGAWRPRAPWTLKRWWKKLEKCWNRIAVIMNSAKISCYSVAMAIPLTRITCSGRWRCVNCLGCHWTGFVSNVSPGHRLTSRTSRLRLQTSWSCDRIIWFECRDLRNWWRTGNDLGSCEILSSLGIQRKKLLTKDALGFLELHGSHDLLENGELLFFDGGQKIMFLLHQNVCADKASQVLLDGFYLLQNHRT